MLCLTVIICKVHLRSLGSTDLFQCVIFLLYCHSPTTHSLFPYCKLWIRSYSKTEPLTGLVFPSLNYLWY